MRQLPVLTDITSTDRLIQFLKPLSIFETVINFHNSSEVIIIRSHYPLRPPNPGLPAIKAATVQPVNLLTDTEIFFVARAVTCVNSVH